MWSMFQMRRPGIVWSQSKLADQAVQSSSLSQTLLLLHHRTKHHVFYGPALIHALTTNSAATHV